MTGNSNDLAKVNVVARLLLLSLRESCQVVDRDHVEKKIVVQILNLIRIRQNLVNMRQAVIST